jgi:hypothetical protein
MSTKSPAGVDRKYGWLTRVRTAGFGRVGVRSFIAALVGATMLVAFAGANAYAAGFVPSFGAASPYAILAATAGANAGLSNVTGDLGLASSASTSAGASASSGSSGLLGGRLLSGAGTLAGSLLGAVSGATITNDAAASVAESAAAAAYQAISSEAPTRLLSGGVLSGATLTPGVYAVTGSLDVVGRLLLDAGGDRNAAFIFQIPSDLTTAPGAQILLGAGAQASNVVWRVGDAADLGTSTSLAGTILSNGSITLGSGSKLVGRALSMAGAVKLNNDSIALPLVSAAVSAAGKVGAVASSVAVPRATVRLPHHVNAATPSTAISAGVTLPLSSLHGLGVPAPALPSVPAIGSLASGASGIPAGLGLPFIPLQGIGVPALAVPTLGLPTVPLAALGLPAANLPTTTSPTAPLSAVPPLALPFIPLQGIGVPALAVPTLGLPTVPFSALGLLPANLPTTTSPTAPSNATPATLPLSLGGISLPQLLSPTASTLPSGVLPQITLPSVTLPSITSRGLALPKLSVTPSASSDTGKLVRPRVKESSTGHSTSGPHAKSTSGTAPASSSTIPVGAPQTGLGDMIGPNLETLLALSALLLAVCAGTLAVRTRRMQRG